MTRCGGVIGGCAGLASACAGDRHGCALRASHRSGGEIPRHVHTFGLADPTGSQRRGSDANPRGARAPPRAQRAARRGRREAPARQLRRGHLLLRRDADLARLNERPLPRGDHDSATIAFAFPPGRNGRALRRRPGSGRSGPAEASAHARLRPRARVRSVTGTPPVSASTHGRHLYCNSDSEFLAGSVIQAKRAKPAS